MTVSLVKRVCAWCQKSMGLKAWVGEGESLVTHGICDDCVKKIEVPK